MNVFETWNTFSVRAIRVLRIAHRPHADEFRMMAKTTGLGMVLIGFIGFLVTLLFSFI